MLILDIEKESIYQLSNNFENGRFKLSGKDLREFMFKGMSNCWERHLNKQSCH